MTVCDAHHCCVNDTAHITGPPPIAITFTIVNNACFGQCNGSATVSAAGGVPPYTYLWNNGFTTSTITNLCAGIYTVTVTDSNHLHVFKDTVISAPIAIGQKIDSTPITCFNAANATLNDSVWGGTAPYTITWTPGGANPLSAQGPGMYIVNVTDAHGCPAADTAYIGQPAQLTAAIVSTDSAICFGQSNGYANVQAQGGTQPYHYAWSGSNSIDSFANNLAAGAQTVTVTDRNGCSVSVPFTIYQPAALVINAVDTISAHCSSSHDGHAVAVVSGGLVTYNYNWDGTSSGAVDSTIGLAVGNHTLTVTDSKGCTTSATFYINTQYTLAILLTSDSVSCNGGSDGIAITSVLNGTPNYVYAWSPSSSTTDSATALSAGTQNVTVTDQYGCTATGSVAIGQPNPISDVPSFADPKCTGQSNGKVWITAGGTVGPYTYTFGGVVHAITDTVFNLASGTYNFTVTDGRGCTKADAVTLTDPIQLQIPQPNVTGISCANDANGIIQVFPTGGTLPYTYLWSPGGYTTALADSLAPNTYTIAVTDANGCSASVTTQLIAPAAIYFAALSTDSTSCPGSADGRIVIIAAGGTPGANIPYTYSLDGNTWQQGNLFLGLPAGSYHIFVKDSPGCVLDTFISIYQPAAITASINPQDSLIALGTSIQLYTVLNNLTTQTINSYSWTPANGLSCIDCPNPVASPYQTTRYYLTVNYGRNCFASDSNIIEVGHGGVVYVPHAFTPNGDGVNDYFSVFGTGLQSVGMKIFNRWGEKVFDSGSDQWASWDGTYQGVLQPTGVYVYYIELVYLDGSSAMKEGSITLIR